VSDIVARRMAKNPSGRLGTAEDIAATVAFLLSPDADYLNGQVLSVDGGVTMR
jgi:3-oxoacyl-[acyl-carrier protein] reductase